MTSEPVKTNLPPLKPIRFRGSQTLGLGTLPSAQYGLFSEKIRQTSSKDFHCSVFCPGKKCKFEGAAFWRKEDMAIMGLYSHWITDDIVTMARPSTEVIEKYEVITQFRENGIKSLINLQERGEHGSCGVPLERSGFTYDPQVFMENKIFYYNFDWKDYGSVPKTALLDMVKVLTFALTEGKVAIHSHAGVGRTGVLVACYLIYTLRCKPNDAVTYVRTKRPDSVQTRSQVESVQGFAQFVVPLFLVFSNVIPRDHGFSLNVFLRRQRHLLHGFESRLLKYIPKPIFMFCERLLALTDSHRLSTETDITMSAIMDSPNRFLGFFSAYGRFNVHFHHLTEDKWTLKLPPINGDQAMPNFTASSGDGHARSVPSSEQQDSNHAFPESPDSSSSPEEDDRKLSRIGCAFRSEEDVLDFPLSEDEEQGITPELEYSLHSANLSSIVNRNFSNAVTTVNEANLISVPVNEANLNSAHHILSQDNPEANEDELKDDEANLYKEIYDEDEVGGVDDKDPVDMNSEECNDIIESVLQESPLEAERKKVVAKRDVFTSKENKGCSTVGVEADNERTFSNGDIVDALLADHYTLNKNFASLLRKYQRALNNKSSTWQKVSQETDPLMLSALLWSWLDDLKEPVLNKSDLSVIVIRADKPLEILKRLDYGTRYTTEYLVRFVAQLQPKNSKVRDDLLRRLVASLTHQTLGIRGTLRPVGLTWNKMRQGTTGQVLIFINTLYDMVVGEPIKTMKF